MFVYACVAAYLLQNGWTDLAKLFFVSSSWSRDGFRPKKFGSGIKPDHLEGVKIELWYINQTSSSEQSRRCDSQLILSSLLYSSMMFSCLRIISSGTAGPIWLNFFLLAPSWSRDGFRPKKFRIRDPVFPEIQKKPGF